MTSTRLALQVPGSHLAGRHPTKEEAAEGGKAAGAVPLCAPAGTCIVFDSRCWVCPQAPSALLGLANLTTSAATVQHMSGGMAAQEEGTEPAWVEPHTGKPWRLGVFMNYVGPQIRQNENYAMSLDPCAASEPLMT